MPGVTRLGPTGNPIIDGTLIGDKWSTNVLTF